jgi:hypothetical protein
MRCRGSGKDIWQWRSSFILVPSWSCSTLQRAAFRGDQEISEGALPESRSLPAGTRPESQKGSMTGQRLHGSAPQGVRIAFLAFCGAFPPVPGRPCDARTLHKFHTTADDKQQGHNMAELLDNILISMPHRGVAGVAARRSRPVCAAGVKLPGTLLLWRPALRKSDHAECADSRAEWAGSGGSFRIRNAAKRTVSMEKSEAGHKAGLPAPWSGRRAERLCGVLRRGPSSGSCARRAARWPRPRPGSANACPCP